MKIQKSQIGITLIGLIFFFFAGFRGLAQEKWTAPQVRIKLQTH
jgi:hypothetical protein